MGSYLNPGNALFKMAVNSQIFVDKSMLIDVTNRYLNTMQRFICVSRPRRFGKSVAADMLAAYYDRSVDSSALFEHLEISSQKSYGIHLNQYDVVKLNMQEFLSGTKNVDEMLERIQKFLIFDLLDAYHQVRFRDEKSLIQVMKDVYSHTGHPFVILIDEWDCLFREYKHSDPPGQICGGLNLWPFWLPHGLSEP